MVRDTQELIARRQELEALRRDLIEINRSGLAQAARIVEIMEAGLDGGEDARIWSGLHQLRRLFAPTGEPDTAAALLAEVEVYRERANDEGATDEEVDVALERFRALSDKIPDCRPTTLSGAVAAISLARREWEGHHNQGGPGDAEMSALLAAADVLTWAPPMARAGQ